MTNLVSTDCLVDVVFVVDSSGSIFDMGEDNFPMMLGYVMAVINRLDVRLFGTRVGIVTYSTFARLELPLNGYHTKDSLLNVVKNIR